MKHLRRRQIGRNRLWRYVVAVVALALGVTVIVIVTLRSGSSHPAPATPATMSSTPADEPDTPPVVVSVLSDSHAYNTGSWWRQTVVAGKVPGAEMGAFQSQPGAESTTLVKRLDAAATHGGLVLVQVGTNDLIAGRQPAAALTGIEALWDGITKRGATPVAMLVPPSNKHGQQTVELNDLIRKAAAQRGLALIDVYTVVANPDGTWRHGLTTDGIHANAGGSARMAAAAQEQIEAIAAKYARG